MTSSQDPREVVYIFENSEADRVKVGMTTNYTVSVSDRLLDVNRKWQGMNATCQICGSRRLLTSPLVPPHRVSGIECHGGRKPPMEQEVTLAESYLEELRSRHEGLSGSEKGSNTRIMNTLEKRIEKYRNYQLPVGIWRCHTVFYTNCAEGVEQLAHKILEEQLDTDAPFGEVFFCTVPEAIEAVEAALSQMDLLESAGKERAEQNNYF